MFEAIIRTKIIYLEKSGLFSIDENEFQNIIHIQNDISEGNFQNVCESLQILPKLTSGLSRYIESYLDMVTLPFNTIYVQRTGNWKGFIQCIREFLPYCFSLNRQNYAINLSHYHIHISNLENSHPEMFNHMLNQGFTVSLSEQPFTRISYDQVIQMTINRASKDTGGLSEKTENAGASERWMRIKYLMAAMRQKPDQVTRKRTTCGHVDLGRKRLLNDKQDVETLASCLFTQIQETWENNQPIINLATGL